jgi:hypothetical protein
MVHLLEASSPEEPPERHHEGKCIMGIDHETHNSTEGIWSAAAAEQAPFHKGSADSREAMDVRASERVRREGLQ